MSNEEKEVYAGKWFGQDVVFNRTWGGHRFTDQECEDLLDGREIELYNLTSKKTGKNYGTRGMLARQVYMGKSYVGFQPNFAPSKAGAKTTKAA